MTRVRKSKNNDTHFEVIPKVVVKNYSKTWKDKTKDVEK